MRLWHKDLIPVLPRQQLLGQWRECCSIAKAYRDGTLKHRLVSKANQYPPEHLYSYGVLVGKEMERRGIKVNPEKFLQYFYDFGALQELPAKDVFDGWHNADYFWECWYNLREKYHCGIVSEEEWKKLDPMKLKAWRY